MQTSSSPGDEGAKVSESILRLFPGFDAFMLPPPTVDSELMKTLTEEKDRVNPSFWSALDKFKPLIRSNLAPKHSYNHGEYVTGEGNIIKSVKSELNFSRTLSYYGDMSRNAC